MKSLALNKRAKFDYDIKDTFDAGLMLTGPEVKSAKQGGVHLTGSYVKVSDQGAFLIGAHIAPYKYAMQDGYEPTQTRKLLLTKKELNALLGKEKGITIIPLELFVNNKNLVKLKIGLGRGRRKEDKREYIKQRDQSKEIRQVTDR